MPTAPGFFSQVAKAEWRRMGRLLIDAGVLTSLDTTALALYCSSYARYVKAEEMLEQDGAVTEGVGGSLISSPYIAISNQAMIQMTRLLGEFGMTPASRTRIPGTQGAEKSSHRSLGANQQSERGADPRDILKMGIQAAKN